ncbi:MAG: universal stress protein [Bacteroidetes bacterium]|nr:universal stress protein [Bacteroidota bacterium]
MAKGILCVIDFTEPSKDALRCAVSLAKKLNDPLSILFTYRLLQPMEGEAVKMKKQIELDALKKFSDLEKEFLSDAGVAYDFKTEVGFLTDRVKEHAKKIKIDFLVVGKKLNTLQKQSIEELVENLNRPLIIVP